MSDFFPLMISAIVPTSALEAPPTEQAVGVEVHILALALRADGETFDTCAFNPLSHVR